MEESSSVFSESPFGTQNTTPASSSKGPSKRGKKLVFLILIIIILAAIAFGAMQLLGNTSTEDATPTPTIEEFVLPTDTPAPTEPETDGSPAPTSSTTTTPAPTSAGGSSSSVDPVTKLDRADLTIVVQNGSGEAGVANVMKEKLEDLGYVVSSTGNADNFDYTETVIQVKAASKDFVSLLRKDLGDDYTIGSATSDYTGSGDAVVIVGAE
ncbi:MAG: LytR C-terminal domain-containing protein [Candidatus Levybacteria bacterium]|nr:LytR C-terminal domain-containing protein [Candidatus Levybacteria bacterium]